MALSRYVQQLLEDIRNAVHNAPEPSDPNDPADIAAHFDAIDRYTSPEHEHGTLKDVIGLSADQFPPKEKLTDEEMKAILRELARTLRHFNYEMAIPKEIPLHFKYDLIQGIFDYEAPISAFSMMTMDFCAGWPDDCELKQYCSCRRFEDEEMEQDIEAMPSTNWQEHLRKTPTESYHGNLLRKQVELSFRSIEDRDFILNLLSQYPGIEHLFIKNAPPESGELPF